MKLAEKLVLQRKQKGLSQVQLAETIHVTRQAVSRWEVGDAVPSMDNLKRISELYALPMEYFLNDDTEEPTAQTVPVRKAKQEKRPGHCSWTLRIVLIVAIFALLMAILVGAVGNREKNPEISAMNEIARKNVLPDSGGDFDLEW